MDRAPLSIQSHTLGNGLRVILQHDDWLPLVAINLWYHVGSKNERPERTGFAHLFEHMLFQGSEHVPENGHFHYVQQVGGVANGSTWYDRTNYYETLPAHHLDLGLWLEADRMGFLLAALTEEKLAKQRQVVMNERRERVDNRPYGLALERLHELLFPSNHPYRWPVIGYMDHIAAATLPEVRQFFETYYVPNNAVLTLVGDLEPDRVLERVCKYFEPLSSGPDPPAVRAGIPAVTSQQREILRDSVQLPRVYLGYCVPSFGHKQWYAANLLSLVLAGGKSSLLYQDLVYRRQIAHSVAAYLSKTEDCATLILVATGKPDADPFTLEDSLLEHMRQLADNNIVDADLERARNRRLTAHFSELQRYDRKADLLSNFETFFQDPPRLTREATIYSTLHRDDLQEVVREFCGDDHASSVIVVPKEYVC